MGAPCGASRSHCAGVYARPPSKERVFTPFSQADHAQITGFPHIAGRSGSGWRRRRRPWSKQHRTGTSPCSGQRSSSCAPTEFLVLAGGRPVGMTVRELELLTALMERRGPDRSAARSCYREVWGDFRRKADRSVDVYVGKLRQKLREGAPRAAVHPHPFRVRLPLQRRSRRPTGGILPPSHLFHDPATAG